MAGIGCWPPVSVAFGSAERHTFGMNPSRPLHRIAIYARYSSDLQNPSSVDDQVALCRKLGSQQFGIVSPDHVLVFSDAAISGATMERAGIRSLLTAVEAHVVDLVVAEGLDRLSRSLKDIATLYEMLSYHGVGIWTAHEGRITELHIGLKGTMNALYLRDMKERVKRGHRGRIAAGFAASSCAFGYRVVRGQVDAKGRTVNGVREIDEAAAAVIRRAYDEYAGGMTIPAIVEGLNRDGIPAPNGGLWKRNALMGGAKKQEGILRNEIYLGKLIFNRHRVVRDPVTNKKRYILNPEAEWMKVEVPHLRIVADILWAAVRARDNPRLLAAGSRAAKPPAPAVVTRHNEHPLTDWVKCGWCGGSKSLANATRYLCSTHRYAKACKNARGTKEAVLMAATFEALQARIADGPDFRPAFLRAFAQDMRRTELIEAKKDDIRARMRRLLDAVERGVAKAHVTTRVVELQADLEQLERAGQGAMPGELPNEASIRHTLARAVAAVELAGDIIGTRLMFKCVLDSVVCTPVPDRGKGETVVITLREEGWPEYWRLICFAAGRR